MIHLRAPEYSMILTGIFLTSFPQWTVSPLRAGNLVLFFSISHAPGVACALELTLD